MNPDQHDNYWQHDPDEVIETNTPELNYVEEKKDTAVDVPVSWTASEYIHLEKNGLWYVGFALVVIGLVAVDLFLLKSYSFSVLVLVMAAAVIVYSRRQPRAIQYMLSGKLGLYIGERLYNFDDFKAFGLIRDGEHHSIMLIPVKRFSPGVSVYFPDEAGEKIVDILGARLPMEILKLDAIDVIVRRLRL
ncbi:hypothetical protein H7X68_02045 [Candidatus Saccharibacteria bacterium]|nr:hypothetical protein [Candidatus Saccharibacteria bacterium]